MWNYNFTLDTTTSSSPHINIFNSNNIYGEYNNSGILNFERLYLAPAYSDNKILKSGSETRATLGTIYINQKDINQKAQCIDAIVNNTVLTKISSMINAQSIDDFAVWVNYGLKFDFATFNNYANFYEVYNYVDYLKSKIEEGKIYPDVIKSLYGDYVDTPNTPYAEYIYRARGENRIECDGSRALQILKNGGKYFIPTIFTCYAEDSAQIKFYYRIKSIDMPMKMIKTSTHTSSDHKSYSTYICMLPEYILTQYQEFKDSIKWISYKCTGTYKDIEISYSYLNKVNEEVNKDDENKKSLLWIPISKTLGTNINYLNKIA